MAINPILSSVSEAAALQAIADSHTHTNAAALNAFNLPPNDGFSYAARNIGGVLSWVRAEGSGGDNTLLEQHISNTDVHVTPAWTGNVMQTLAELVTFSQRTDIFVTQDDKDAWNEAIATASNALAMAQTNAGQITDLDGRLTQVEDAINSGISSNPFTVSFSDLSGIVLTYGVWNNIQHRIEAV